jgi:hypothetical protein
MLNGLPSYAATSTTTPIAQRPKLNGHRSSTGGVPRTKILLLGLRRSVNQNVRSLISWIPWFPMQSWENLNSTSLVQRLVPEANVLSRDYYANNETCVRVRTSTALNYQGPSSR